jgi:hypothetical protein
LYFIGGNNSAKIGVGEYGVRDTESKFMLAVGLAGSEDGIKFFKGALGPDYEPSNVTSRSKLEKVKSVYVT